MTTSNRLLPVLAGVVVLLLIFVMLKSCTEGNESGAVMDSIPQAPSPDADTPADTIKTLTANVAAMTAELGALRRDSEKLREENQALLSSRAQIEENVTSRLKRELFARERAHPTTSSIDSGVLSSLTERVDALSQTLGSLRSGDGSDIPVGLGLNGILPTDSVNNDVVWIEPLDADDLALEKTGLLNRAQLTASGYLETTGEHPWQRERDRADTDRKSEPQKVYTVPRNATLIGSTAMTAMVGRIPIQGEVRDPMPFKLITGTHNLAANGLTVPGVAGMIWSGTAIGDWALSCVTGRLDSVTFVFDDGTIRTIAGDDAQAQRGGLAKSLGWISDDQGIPCISGVRKTNAPAFLAQRIGVMAVQAAADAAAAAQTTAIVSDSGLTSSRVTGNAGSFVLGKTFAGGSDEISKWLLERQSQSFDAVFVPAGTKVAIHVDTALRIDLEPAGRKLNYATSNTTAYRDRLD